MSDLNRFLERNRSSFRIDHKTLFVNLPADAVPGFAGGNHRGAHFFFQEFSAYRASLRDGPKADFGAFPQSPEAPYEEIVLILPREKALLQAWLQWVAGALAREGRLWLAGENRAGIRSAHKVLAEYFDTHQKTDSARHCSLYSASSPVVSDRFDLNSQFVNWTFELSGHRYTASSLPGVFSHGRVDDGTQLLLETLSESRFKGKMLDFGCGSGVISAVLGSRSECLDLTLTDSNGLALVSSERTLALNEVEGSVMAGDGLEQVSGRFRTIVSNPPFHQGIRTKSGMSMAMLESVRNFLEPRGQLIVVVNRHLPYRPWMRELFGNCDTLSQNDRFSVLEARNHP